MKVAVLSDIHATPLSSDYVSLLSGNTPRSPRKGHPIMSLEDLIKKDDLKTDYVFIPGDITDKCNDQGFQIAWDAMCRVKSALKAKEIIATTGNHDVDSYNIHAKGPFDPIKDQLGEEYPFLCEDRRNQYWANSFALIDYNPLLVLVLNSVAAHRDKETAKRGGVTEVTLEQMKTSIVKFSETQDLDSRIRVAMCHHHPHQHSGVDLLDTELMELGDKFLTLLEQYKFSILIHGHKHHPSLEYAKGGYDSTAVFAAGSFSKTTSRDPVNRPRNLFHIISFEENIGGHTRGTIQSWQFHLLSGWTPSAEALTQFPSLTGFGYRGLLSELATKVNSMITGAYISWQEFLQKIPEAKHLIPKDFHELRQELDKNGLEIFCNLEGERIAIGRRIQ